MFRAANEIALRLAEERPVVVMGRGHSGTRVMAWALEALGIRMGALAAKPTGDAQDRRFTRRIKRIALRYVDRPATDPPRDRDVRRLRRAARRYLDWLGDVSSGWGWKFPETYLIPAVVDSVFPRARYLHLVRDGRDLAFKAHLTDDGGRALGRRILEHLGALDRPHYMQAALSWDWQVRRFEEEAARFEGRVHRVPFEELCSDPEATMEATARFLGLEMGSACRDYLRENIRRGKVSQHRDEDPEQVREIEAAIGPTLERFGYGLTSGSRA